jgi:hypothetical protein
MNDNAKVVYAFGSQSIEGDPHDYPLNQPLLCLGWRRYAWNHTYRVRERLIVDTSANSTDDADLESAGQLRRCARC